MSAQMIAGLPVVVHEDQPRYVLPDGVPPPTGMTRQEFAAWSLRVCGVQELFLKDGQVVSGYGRLHMNQRTYERVRKEFAT